MSLLAEVVVEEWLNRQGYFTIRGVRLGNDEIDLLAIRSSHDGTVERRHLEVQASVRPVSYISRVPKQVQKETGRGPNNAKRVGNELEEGVKEWVAKKYDKENKRQLLRILGDGVWTRELVINQVKSEEEVKLIQSHGVVILRLKDIIRGLRAGETVIKVAAGSDLLDLMHLASHESQSLSDEEATFLASEDVTLT